MKNRIKQLFILLIIVLCLGPIIWLNVNEAGLQPSGAASDSLGKPVADSAAVVPADSINPINLDSLGTAKEKSNNLISKLLYPVLLTGLAGAILLLLFTQRGS